MIDQPDDSKPPKDFPLGIAKNGQFCKKFRGQRHHFGAVTYGWRAALECYQHDWPYILAGKVPPSMHGQDGDAITLDSLCNQFAHREAERWKRDQVRAGTYIEIRNTLEIVLAQLGQRREARTLLPDDFADLRYALRRKWTRNKAALTWSFEPEKFIGPDAHKRRIIHVRAMFNFAVENRLLPALPTYGDSFKIVAISQIRKARRERARAHGPKAFPAEQVPLIFAECKGQPELAAAFLLSVLGGFNETDCGKLPFRDVDLENGFIDFDRIKTGVYRRVAMPPLLAGALRTVLENRPKPSDPEVVVHAEDGSDPIRVKDLVFITGGGSPWVTQTVKLRDGHPDKINHHGGFAKRLDEVLIELDRRHPGGVGGYAFKRKGISFGTGRHTFESHAKRVGDDNIVDFIMGHASDDMDQWYDHPDDKDLHAVASAVCERLFGSADQPHGRPGRLLPGHLRLVS